MLSESYSLEILRKRREEIEDEASRGTREKPPDGELFSKMEDIITDTLNEIQKELQDSSFYDFYKIDGFDPIYESLKVCALYRYRLDPIFWPWLRDTLKQLGNSCVCEIFLAISREKEKKASKNKNGKAESFSDHVTHSVLTCIFGEDLLNSGSFGERRTGGLRFLCDFLNEERTKGIAGHCRQISKTTVREDTIRQAWYIAALSHDTGYPLYLKEKRDLAIHRAYSCAIKLLDDTKPRTKRKLRKFRTILLRLFGSSNELKKLVEERAKTLEGKLRSEHIKEESHAYLGGLALIATIDQQVPKLPKGHLLTIFLSFTAVYSHEDSTLTWENIREDPLTTFLKMIDELEVWGRVYYGFDPAPDVASCVRCLPYPRMRWTEDREAIRATYFPSKECRLNRGKSGHKCGWDDRKFWKSRRDLERAVNSLNIFPSSFKIEDPRDVKL